MIKAHKIALIVEMVLVLLPVTLISSYGAIYIIGIGVAEKLRFIPVQAAFMMSVTTICMLAIISLWLLTIGSLKSKEKSIASLIYLPSHIGACIAILSIISVLLWLLFPEHENLFSLLGAFVYGSPALIPYVHAIYIKNYANKVPQPTAGSGG